MLPNSLLRRQVEVMFSERVLSEPLNYDDQFLSKGEINETVDKIVLNPFRVGTGGCVFSTGVTLGWNYSTPSAYSRVFTQPLSLTVPF